MNTLQAIDILSLIIALAIAIIGHEIMHGLVAYKYGDTTAKEQKRLSLNPIVHIDLIGTILIPAMLYFSGAGFLFGWAKPVPINVRVVIQNGGYNGAIAVSLAGIAFNFTLALIATLLLYTLPAVDSLSTFFLKTLLTYTVIYNIVLGIFNLYPIPPLDGSHAISHLFSKMGIYSVANFYHKIGQYGMILLILIIATPLSTIIFTPIQMIITTLLPH
ncbi:MAG: site-2 protease family protein [Epsilonproteobacteria bacterium]|nr:site-2 protease family protein [Campylobacterota bacterium]